MPLAPVAIPPRERPRGGWARGLRPARLRRSREGGWRLGGAPPGLIRLEIRDPTLIVLVGAAGSGKSTLAARLFAADEVLSSDAFRAVAAGDPADQRVTRTAFGILHRQLDRRLRAQQTTVIDATSVTAFARRQLVRRATAVGIPAVAIVLALDDLLVLSRNATREGRIVPEDVVRRQLLDVARSLRRGLDDEGFAAIRVVRTAEELDSLQVRRSRPR